MTLPELPSGLPATRDLLHQIAYFVLSPALYRETGRMGLRATPRGFGTPEFEGRVARLEGVSLVSEVGEEVWTDSVTTIARATEFLGIPYDVDWFTDFGDRLTPFDPDLDLAVDPMGADFVANWFDFGFETLTALRGDAGPNDEASEPQLWPEHFDAAIEMGSEGRGLRASYGASPGDHAHDEPYVYVSSWGTIDRSNPYWNDLAFNGASLDYRSIQASDDPAGMVIDFMRDGYEIIHSI